jgi:Glycoside hydrolase family 44
MKKKNLFLSLVTILISSLVLSACGSNVNLSQFNTLTPAPTSALDAGKIPTPQFTLTVAPAQATPTPAPTRANPNALQVRIDQKKVLNPISPLIYGLADSDPNDPNYITELRPTLTRWGGNPTTRYNWVYGNAFNSARDFEFRNGNFGATGAPGQRYVADDAVENAQENDLTFLLTIPTMGWVAKNDNSNIFSKSVPNLGEAAFPAGSESIRGYNPAANRQLTSVQSKARKNAPFVDRPDPFSPVIYQDEWVNHLVKKFGRAADGGVRFYAMDNEPDLWCQTHTDVNPVCLGYDGTRDIFLEYANAVKDVDPTAMVTGPVVSGWLWYFYSELDRGNDNFRTAAERKAHNDTPLIPWFLSEVKKADDKSGRRSLDVLDIHYYPQGVGIYEGRDDATTQALRLRSTRALWDKNYVDESWIDQPINLIPLMQSWINAYYPGTKLAITEWNWGADTTLNGGLAIANVLGTFGREGVYLAAYWRFPPAKSPGFYAFKMFTNFDDKGSTFGDQAVAANNTDLYNVSSFAAVDTKTNRLRIMLVNNQPDKERDIEITLANPVTRQNAKVYELSNRTGAKLANQPDIAVSGSTFELKLPAYSVVLIDLAL